MTEPPITVLPYGGRLGASLVARPLDDLNWPSGRYARLEGGAVRCSTSDDHLIVYPKTAMHF